MTDNTPRELIRLVLDKIAALGDERAAAYFEVSRGTISGWKTLKTFPSIVAAQKVWDETLLCQAPETWGRSGTTPVQILMPIYETMEPLTFLTLFRCLRLYGMEKTNLIPKLKTLIVEARNDLAERFLLTDSEWAIFPDSDCVLPCGSGAVLRGLGLNFPEPKASFNAIERLMSHPADKLIVGALYRDRKKGIKVQCEIAFRSEAENTRLMGLFDGKIQGDGLEETGWVGFGLVRVHRSVFESMKKAAEPGGILAEEMGLIPGRENEALGYFRTTPAQRGEDVAFCRRAGRLGITTYFDSGLLLGHVGKKIY